MTTLFHAFDLLIQNIEMTLAKQGEILFVFGFVCDIICAEIGFEIADRSRFSVVNGANDLIKFALCHRLHFFFDAIAFFGKLTAKLGNVLHRL